MKKIMNILPVVFILAISGIAFGQSKPGEGYYDSGVGRADAPGSSSTRDRNDAAQEREKAAKQARILAAEEQNRLLPERQVRYDVEASSQKDAIDKAIKWALETGAKTATVLVAKEVLSANAAKSFEIVLGVCFPATSIDRSSELRRDAPAPAPQPKKERGSFREADDHGNAKN